MHATTIQAIACNDNTGDQHVVGLTHGSKEGRGEGAEEGRKEGGRKRVREGREEEEERKEGKKEGRKRRKEGKEKREGGVSKAREGRKTGSVDQAIKEVPACPVSLDKVKMAISDGPYFTGAGMGVNWGQ